ncbi:MAG: hypothetical protein J6L86_06270 [Alphaproteobacteria bacterium]|nr:hypothetical protein [Alphaproteobacteria bacterium]MBQ8631443.1 hypothetical protein [Alphaproteobacteria bacterium]MDY4841579.1 hypothetical protein [Alphaproteobacteria bacterium]
MTEEINAKTGKQIRQDLKKLKILKELFEKTLYGNTAENACPTTQENKKKDFVRKLRDTIKSI